jgi:predicted DNA-binding transcriptional regulator YafY
MNRTERFYKIEDLLRQHGCLSFKQIQAALEVSRATLTRDLTYLRDRFQMPIVHDREAGGYRFAQSDAGKPVQYELPGLWFSAQEIHALLTMHRLIANLDTGGLLGPHIQPLLSRMNLLLGAADNPAEEVVKRIRLLSVGAREFHLDHFQLVGSALLRRKRLMLDYHARSTDQASRREVSPQRLIHYRHNWYLDAWCHTREALRSFAVDAIHRVELLDRPAIDVEEDRLDAVLGAGYGIFSGEDVNWATLRFSPKLARWVAAERWHPDQIGRLLEDGGYELKLPYSEDTELVMDVLRYGVDCEVVGPDELRRKIEEAVQALARMYDKSY